MGFFSSRDVTTTTTVESTYIDPVTGRPLSAAAVAAATPAPATHASSTHSVSTSAAGVKQGSCGCTTTRNILWGTTLAVALGGLAFAAYRCYQKQQLKKKKLADASNIEHLAYPVVVVEDPAELDQTISEVESKKKIPTRVFILVEGAKEGPNNESWCGDCVKAEPILRQVFEENCDKVILIDAPVRRADYKGTVPHPYRTHPELQVQRIPTLYKWENGHVVDALVESELFDIDRVRKFVR